MSKVIFQKKSGVSYHGDSLKLIKSNKFINKYKGKIDLIFTSPPFNLIRKKKYDNKYGDDYIKWLAEFSQPLSDLLTATGSIIIELGNSWNKGEPTFSTVPMEALLEFKKKSDLYLCQEFICYNNSRIPSPAQWVTVNRIRVKDSFTRVWWLSKTPYPKSDNSQVLIKYSNSMLRKLKNGKINTGKRPSGHIISDSFLKNNGGSIPPNFLNLFNGEFLFEEMENCLSISNSSTQKAYNNFCEVNQLPKHPARMQIGLTEYFIRFLTDKDDLVFDPFGGSNTTGMVSEVLKRKWISCEKDLDYIKGSLIRFYNENKSRNIIEKLAKGRISKLVK